MMGYLVAGSALAPIERMRRHASTISSKSSADRLPVPAAQDELRRLGRTLNAMLDRLDAGLRRERRFVAEASHELRTPLALLRMELDLALTRPRDAAELRAALDSASEEVDRLTRLAEDLLLLAAGDDGRLELAEVDVDTGDLLRELADRFTARASAQDRRIQVTSDLAVLVRADRMHLERAVSNLVDNALRHGGGDIRLSAEEADGWVVLRVSDRGAGVDVDFRRRAFDPFSGAVEAGSARSQGLGLAIVQTMVRAHRGTVSIEDGTGGEGMVVAISLPGPGCSLAEPGGTTLPPMPDGTYTVERRTHIDAPPWRVYEQIVDFHNWTHWSPWEDLDPDMQRTYAGPGSGPGAVYRWSGNRRAGRGTMEITHVSEPSTVEIDLAFEKPLKSRSRTTFSIDADGNGSGVIWSMTGPKTAMTKVMGVFTSMDKLIGPDFEKGLARLRAVAEEFPG